MATNNIRLMPVVVIDHCPSDEIPSRKLIRSCSLTNCSSMYKDLQGAIHSSSSTSKYFDTILFRCRSYPACSSWNLFEITGKSSLLQSPSTSFNMNSLDPNVALGGTQTPGGSSSRYSLYGSFFDVSECGAYSPTSNDRTESKLLTFAGRPLLIVDPTSRTTSNTFQDKCLDWLRQLKSNTN